MDSGSLPLRGSGMTSPIMTHMLPALIDDLVIANHILYNEGVVDGFGHVSVRHPERPDRYLLSASLAPAVVKRDDIIEFDLDSNAIDAQGRKPKRPMRSCA